MLGQGKKSSHLLCEPLNEADLAMIFFFHRPMEAVASCRVEIYMERISFLPMTAEPAPSAESEPNCQDAAWFLTRWATGA